MINLLVPVGAVDRAVRIQDLLHSSQDLRNILREFARRRPGIHLEGERVRQALPGEPFQGHRDCAPRTQRRCHSDMSNAKTRGCRGQR